MRSDQILGGTLAAVLTPLLTPVMALAAEYLTVEEAQRSAFPAASTFISTPLVLSDEQCKAIRENSGEKCAKEGPKAWKAYRDQEYLGVFMVDQTVGKHLAIDFAVAISPEGEVQRVEILKYRENYGGEVRGEEWRAHFVGKILDDSLHVGEGIPHIAGATISTKNVTAGVRKLLAVYGAAFR